MGDPCAGQVNAISLLSDFNGSTDLTAGSFGFADPIGSKTDPYEEQPLLT